MTLNSIYKKIPALFPNEEIKRVLEVRPKDGEFANFLVENSIDVTAIDIERSPLLNEKIYFEQMDFEDYTTNEVFDLVHARNVIPFFKDKVGQIAKLFTLGTYVYFTFFGPKDPWAESGRSLAKEAISHLLANVEILYFKEEEYVAKTMRGIPKAWHVYTYLVKTR